jgi:MarR family transcriptional regulator, organic hydroperoxide resistance regulator
MVRRLQAEIKQRKPFGSLEEEAYLNLLRTADALFRGEEALLKPLDLSPPQYNVLRILRGAGADGLACKEIADRMLTRDPDVTRLLDRLEQRGLAVRAREQRDRRVITARITEAGSRVLKQLDRPILELQRQQLGHLGKKRLEALVLLLESAREKAS